LALAALLKLQTGTEIRAVQQPLVHWFPLMAAAAVAGLTAVLHPAVVAAVNYRRAQWV